MSTQPNPAALQDMIDKIEIGEMQSRYMFALDWYDADTYASLFTEDALLEWPDGHAKGRAAIHASCVGLGNMYRGLAAAAVPAKMAHKRHFVSNRVIEIDGDRAKALCYWFDFNNDNLARWPYVQAYGYYKDELIRAGAGWLFTQRKIMNEIIGESPPENPAW